MTKRSEKVFIDSNMIIFAAAYKKDDVFDWINQLYSDVYIHIDVYHELLISEICGKVDEQIRANNWILFDPETMSPEEQAIYDERMKDVSDGFRKMNDQRIVEGKPLKTVSNIGEIATITACLYDDWCRNHL